MPDDPTANARQLLVDFLSEEAVDPLIAMTAMLQIAAKISYDFGKREDLDDALNGERWLGGCMMAFDAAAGGKFFENTPVKKTFTLLKGGLDKKAKAKKRRKFSRASRKKNR